MLFLLDPQYLFSVCYGVQRIYENYIIVGIGHKGLDFQKLSEKTRVHRVDLYRSRDFLPWQLDKAVFPKEMNKSKINEIINTSGQANKFAQFINHQLLNLLIKNLEPQKIEL